MPLTEGQQASLHAIQAELDAIWAEEESGPDVIHVGAGQLREALASASPGDVLDLDAQTFHGNYEVPPDLTLRNGSIVTDNNSPGLILPNPATFEAIEVYSNDPTTNDLVAISGDNVRFFRSRIEGNGSTKRGVSAQGTNMLFEDTQIRNIRRLSTETQAIAMWSGSGLTMRRCVLEGGSQSFLSGGARTDVPNHVPENLLFEDCLMTRPPEWRTGSYSCKTAFELKNARHVVVRNCVLENIWSQGQTGIAITLTPSNYAGDSPETTVEDVLFEFNTIQNVGGGINALGYSQHQAERPTQRGNNYRFIGNTWTLSKALYGGQGALAQLGWSPLNVLFEGNQITADGDAMIRITDTRPVEELRIVNNPLIRVPGTYGIFAPNGNIRGINFATICPRSEIRGNTFYSAHATFRTNFPDNTYR